MREKLFSQDEVSRIVSARVNEVRAKLTKETMPNDVLVSLLTSLDARVSALEAEQAMRRQRVQRFIDDDRDDLTTPPG